MMKTQSWRFPIFAAGALLFALAITPAFAQKGVWTDPKDDTLPTGFQIQGEYVGETQDKQKLGAQVIALGKGAFQAVLYRGGLPGAGWDGSSKSLMDGKLLDDGSARFQPAEGKKKYLANQAKDFSATSKFPPEGHLPALATIQNETLAGSYQKGPTFELKKTARESETMGKEPPQGAIVLFDGENTNHFKGGRLDGKTGLLNTDGKDILTKQKFNDYTMHLEFLLPYRPDARGQGRGNSGFYQVDHYEVQILDSFGLDGKNNECGGVYQLADPKVNMCLPPLTWQTYDVEFTNAKTDENGKVLKPAQMTVKHNGVVIHDKLVLKKKTGGSRGEAIGTPGSLKLQGHGNPLQFRNIWIVEK